MPHTPGPWHLQFLGAHEADLIHKGTFAGINGGSGCPGVLDAEDYATWDANARLISAAPDLLDAILKSDDAHWTPAMRAAIAKATIAGTKVNPDGQRAEIERLQKIEVAARALKFSAYPALRFHTSSM